MKYLFILFVACLFISCDKGWLDAKPNKSLVVPLTVADYQSLLNNTLFTTNDPASFGELGTDDLYFTDAYFLSMREAERNPHIWAKENFYPNDYNSAWADSYKRILKCNVALDGLSELSDEKGSIDWNNARGSALFYRAFIFHQLASLFCKPFVADVTEGSPGIPLRLNSNINTPVVRNTIGETYGQIIDDLTEAFSLLPEVPVNKLRPGKQAVDALLARVYLTMEQYDLALLHADRAILAGGQLMAYHEISSMPPYPFQMFNEEVIYQSISLNFASLSQSFINQSIFSSYADGDLRKNLFFTIVDGHPRFRGSYYGSRLLFSGLALDEMYFIAAECYVRNDDLVNGLSRINTLLEKRWDPALFADVQETNQERLLACVLEERRKQLIFRGVRWTDLRRLNRDPRFAKAISRVVDGQQFTLAPDDLRYVLPIDDAEIAATGMEQNPR